MSGRALEEESCTRAYAQFVKFSSTQPEHDHLHTCLNMSTGSSVSRSIPCVTLGHLLDLRPMLSSCIASQKAAHCERPGLGDSALSASSC